jgi:hypothetical protein
LFPLLREWGATGLLIEWEDTFPYVRDLAVLGSNGPSCPAGSYTAEEAREFLKLAGDAGLAVVPLIQTIGHLEVTFINFQDWLLILLENDETVHFKVMYIYLKSLHLLV